jgi:predicted amidohydrolase YtcJ
VDLSPPRVKSIDGLIAVLKAKAAKTPKGVTVRGFNYYDTVLGRHPTRQDLDRASETHPIIIAHSSGHIRACNSLALKLAGVTTMTKNPAGGELDRDGQGEPTGVLKESAAWKLVTRALPESPAPPRADTIEGYRQRFREYFRNGITAVHVAGVSPATADLLAAAVNDEVPMRLVIMLREDAIDEAVRRALKLPAKTRRVRFGPIKFFHGNSLSGRTCWLSRPYADRPNYWGIPPARSQAQLNELVLKVHTANLQACVHANGDREIDMVLTAYENALAKHPRADHRHRIEHCSVVTEALLARIKALKLVVAPHSYEVEHGDKMEAYGPERWDWMHANRSMIELGIPVAGTSDSPVSAARPLLRIESMVTRRCDSNGKVYGAKQRTTPEQALAAWTRGSAYAGFDEQTRGSLEPGKQADFLVLSADPTTVAAERIRSIEVETTVVEGRVVAGKRL